MKTYKLYTKLSDAKHYLLHDVKKELGYWIDPPSLAEELSQNMHKRYRWKMDNRDTNVTHMISIQTKESTLEFNTLEELQESYPELFI